MDSGIELQAAKGESDDMWRPAYDPVKTEEVHCKVVLESQPSTAQLVKNIGKTFKYLCCLLIILMVIANLALIITIMVFQFSPSIINLQTTASSLEYIATNLNSDPIVNLTSADAAIQCPLGTFAINLGWWQGDNGDSKFYQPQAIYKWRGRLWCANTLAPGTDYVKQVTCPDGFRQCSAGICVLNTIQCPITSVELTASSVDNTSQPYGPTQYLTIRRDEGQAPLVGMIITDNDRACFRPGVASEGPTNSYPFLASIAAKNCGRYGYNTFFTQDLDRLDEFSLFLDNDFPEMFLSNNKTTLQHTPAVLSSSTRIVVNNKDFCQTMDMQKINSMYKATNKLSNVVAGLSITLIILFTLTFISTLGLNSKDNGKGASKCCFISFHIVQIIFMVVIIVLAFEYRQKMAYYRDYIMEFEDNDCFSVGQTMQVMKDTRVALDEVPMKFAWLASGLIIDSVCLIFIGCVYSCWKAKN